MTNGVPWVLMVPLCAGLDINARDGSNGSALSTAVLYCPPWTAHMVLHHGACPRSSVGTSLLGSYIAAVSNRLPSDQHAQLLATLLEAGAAMCGQELGVLAQSACGCLSATADPAVHVQQWRVMLGVLLRHGASLQVRPGGFLWLCKCAQMNIAQAHFCHICLHAAALCLHKDPHRNGLPAAEQARG